MFEIGLLDFVRTSENELFDIIQSPKYKINKINQEQKKINISQELSLIILNGNDSNDFLSICEWLVFLKSYSNAYFIVTVAKEDKHERLVYLQLGAMQVLNLSTQIPEIPILLKNYLEKMSSQKHSHKSLVLNSANRTLVVDGNKEVELTRLEYKIMNCLSDNIGTTVGYKELISYVWGQESAASKFQLSNLIFSLRGKLDPKDRGLLKTIRSKGYMLADRPQDNL